MPSRRLRRPLERNTRLPSKGETSRITGAVHDPCGDNISTVIMAPYDIHVAMKTSTNSRFYRGIAGAPYALYTGGRSTLLTQTDLIVWRSHRHSQALLRRSIASMKLMHDNTNLPIFGDNLRCF